MPSTSGDGRNLSYALSGKPGGKHALSKTGLVGNRRFGDRLRRLGHRRVDVGRRRRKSGDRRHPCRTRSRRQPVGHRSDLRLRPVGGNRRPGDPRPARKGRAGHEVRPDLGPRGRRVPFSRQPGRHHVSALRKEGLQVPASRLDPRGTGTQPDAAWDHLRRPLSDALAGVDHPHRRHDGGTGEAQGAKGRSVRSGSRTRAWNT